METPRLSGVFRAGEKFKDSLLLADYTLLLLAAVGDALGTEYALPIFGGNLDVVFYGGGVAQLGFLSLQLYDLRAVGVEYNDADGKAEVLEVLTHAEEIACDVVVEKEVLDFLTDGGGRLGDMAFHCRSPTAYS